MDKAKIIKSTRAIDKLLKILSGFLKAGIIVCCVFFVLLFIFGEKLVADSASLNFGSLSISLSSEFMPSFESLRWSIAFSLISASICCCIGLYIISIIRSILKPMLDGYPFEAGTADKIRKLAFITLIGGFAIEICKHLSIWLELRSYDLTSIFNSYAVTGFKTEYILNTNFAIIAIILLMLSHIFRYGEALQVESDETL